MQNLTLTIEGEWWDSLLYKGRLHLFGMDGSLQSFNWEALIGDLGQRLTSGAQDAFRFAFSESNALYRSVLDGNDLEQSFSKLSDNQFSVSKKQLFKHVIDQGDSRFPFPHATSAFYYDRLIVASPEGVHGAIYDMWNDRMLNVGKLTDLPSNQAWPAYHAIAIAGGREGLFEIDLGLGKGDWLAPKTPAQVSVRSTDACDWMFQNIVATSIDSGSYLARYNQVPINDADVTSMDDQTAPQDDIIPVARVQGEIEDLAGLLGPQKPGHNARSRKSFVWGSQDKFYRAENGSITAYRLLRNGKIIQAGQPIPLRHKVDTLVSVQTALFGVVLEFDDGLLVMTSDEKVHEVSGEPVNWRVFPRSKRYENHLHVINDDEISIYSFNQDSGVDQYEKRIGSRYYGGGSET